MNNLPPDLSTDALYLLQNSPQCWEYLLFAQVLTDEIERAKPLKSFPPTGKRAPIPLEKTLPWFESRISVFMAIVNELADTMRSNHDDIFGPPGVSGNPRRITEFAGQIARLYRQLIEWVLSLRFAELEPMCHPVAYEMSFMADKIFQELEDYGPSIKKQIELAVIAGTPITINAILSPSLSNEERVAAAIASLSSNIKLGVVGNKAVSNLVAGYIYVLQNDSMPKLLKIGRTSRSPQERVVELSSATGVPTPFSLAFQAYVEDCAYAESYVHGVLERAGYRVASKREFFNVDLNTAIAVIINAQAIVRQQFR